MQADALYPLFIRQALQDIYMYNPQPGAAQHRV